MRNDRLTIGVYGPERLRFADRLGLSGRLREALSGLALPSAAITGYPAWLVGRVANLTGASAHEASPTCDVMLYLWDGAERPEDPLYQRARAFAQQHGAEAVRVLPLRGAQHAAEIPLFIRSQERFSRDVFFCACPEDADLARRVMRKARRFRLPSQIARRTGRRKLGAAHLGDAAALSEQELDLLPASRNLVLFVSEHSQRYEKMDRATDLFADSRGRQHAQLVLATGQKQEDDNPARQFPARFHRTGETYTDEATGQTLAFSGEPLACDFRGGKIPKQEFLRLMAPLFGSTYDDLNRRHRQRLVRRVTAVASAVVAMAVVATAVLVGLAWDARRNEGVAVENRRIAQEEALTAEAQAANAQEKAIEAEEAAAAAEAEAQEAETQAANAIEQERIALENAAQAEEAAAIAEAEAQEADIQAQRAAASAQEAEAEAAQAEINRKAAEEKAEEAVTSGAEALRMQTTRLIRDARLEEQNGNVLRALQLLLEATPSEGAFRELDPEAEALLRTLLGGGEVFPVLTLPDRTLLGVAGEIMYVQDASQNVTACNLRTGEMREAGEDDLADVSIGAAERGNLSVTLANGHQFLLDNRGFSQLRDENGLILEDAKRHERRPLGLFEALDGRRLVSYSAGETIVWGVASSNARTVIEAHNGPVVQLWVGKESFATAGADGHVIIFDLNANELMRLRTGRPLSSLEVREGLQQAVTCARDGTVALWDLRTGETLWRRRFPGMGVARLDPQGRAVVVGRRCDEFEHAVDFQYDHSRTGVLLSAADGSEIAKFPCNGLSWYGEIFDLNTFVTANINKYYVYSVEDGRQIWACDGNFYWAVSAILGRGGYAFFFGHDFAEKRTGGGGINYYYSPVELPTFHIPNPVRGPAECLIVGIDFGVMINHSEKVSGTIDLEYVQKHRYRHGGVIRNAAYSSDGQYAITASADGTAAILTLDGPFQVLRNGYPLTDANFLPDASAAITVDEEGRVALWPLGDYFSARARAEELMTQ